MNIAEFVLRENKSRSGKIVTVIGLVALTGTIYYVVPIRLTTVQGLLTRFFYFPIFLGGLWFGFRGGVQVALLVSLICSPHIFMELGRNQTLFSDELLELLLFNLVGPIVGGLSDRERRQRNLNQELQSLAALGETAASVAHEIKNMVIPIRGFLRRIHQNHSLDDKAAAYLEIVETETAKLDRMTQDMLSFARHASLQKEEFDLSSLVEELHRNLHGEFRDRGIRLVCTCDVGVQRVLLDRERVSQAILNLLHNALNASPKGKEIRLTTCRYQNFLRITVEDEGVGIPKENLARIFQPFYTTNSKGTGLGLAITQRIVTGHGGLIQVESQVGIGTRITLNFPL